MTTHRFATYTTDQGPYGRRFVFEYWRSSDPHDERLHCLEIRDPTTFTDTLTKLLDECNGTIIHDPKKPYVPEELLPLELRTARTVR